MRSYLQNHSGDEHCTAPDSAEPHDVDLPYAVSLQCKYVYMGSIFSRVCRRRTLPTIKWQASREGVCWVGYCKDLLDGEVETHTERMTLEGRHVQGYFVPAGPKSLEMSRQACNKANEETYPSPLLVNIKLIQPYRE